MRGFLTAMAILSGATTGVSGAYTAGNILFPPLPPFEDISSPEELVLKNIVVGGIVQAVEKDRLVLSVEGLYPGGEKMPLEIKMGDETAVRSFVSHLSSSGAVLFWEERDIIKDDIATGVVARVSLLRQPGELRAIVVTLLPS